MTSHARDWEVFFKEDKFVNQYKTGEHITGQFAKLLIDQSGLIANSKANPDKPLVVLDNACGTGVVSSILQEELDDQAKSKLKLTCGDISQGMLDYVKHRIGVEKWQNVEVKTVDAQDSGLPSSHFTHVISSFGEHCLVSRFGCLRHKTNLRLRVISVHGPSEVFGCP